MDGGEKPNYLNEWFGRARARGNALQDAAQALERIAAKLPKGKLHDDAMAEARKARSVLDE